MENVSELCKVLIVGHELLGCDRSALYLADRVGVSRATLMRYLGDLRHMGCCIVSVRDSSGSVYRLENGEDVVDKMSRWLRLEQERTLLQ